MQEIERDALLSKVANAVGDDAFNRLVGSVKEVQQHQRLRFWQESLLGKAGVVLAGPTEFLDLFGKAKWRDTGRSKDPLTAATTSILRPAITPLGFHKLGSRTFARVHDSVLQYFSFQLSAWGGKDFAVNYAAITLYSPREHFVILPGGRLPRGMSGDGWWASKTHEYADNSMHDVVSRLASHCLPWFERVSTTAGLLAVLIDEHAKIRRPDAHYLFDIACCQTHLGQISEAQQALDQAVAGYRKWHDEMPERTWCLDCIVRCESLLVAIRSSQQEQLLAQWRADSIRNLKLEKIV